MIPTKPNHLNQALVVVFALLLVGCSTGDEPNELELFDPADILGAAQYVVAVDLDGASERGPASAQREWSGTITSLEWSADEAWTGGQRLAVRPPANGESFVFAVNERADLADTKSVIVVVRDIVYDGRPLHLALVVLDENWIPVAGTDVALSAAIEAASSVAKENTRRDGVKALLTESVGFNDDRNIDPTSAVAPRLVTAARIGAGLDVSLAADALLDQWLALPADARQLAAELVDLPPDADLLLDVEWTWRELVVVPGVAFNNSFQWVGAYFPGVGILGPVELNAPGEPTVIVGFGPDASSVDIVAWTGETATPGRHDVLVSLPLWTSDSTDPDLQQVVWVDAVNSSDVVAEILPQLDYEKRLAEFGSGGSQFPGSETEKPDPADFIDK